MLRSSLRKRQGGGEDRVSLCARAGGLEKATPGNARLKPSHSPCQLGGLDAELADESFAVQQVEPQARQRVTLCGGAREEKPQGQPSQIPPSPVQPACPAPHLGHLRQVPRVVLPLIGQRQSPLHLGAEAAGGRGNRKSH